MKLQNNFITLKSLTIDDSGAFYELYFPENLIIEHKFSRVHKNPEEFTEHIISLCNFIFTIRLNDDPQKIIGDCALHHWNKQKKEIEIGGTLNPDFWGKGIMKSAFELLIHFAKNKFDIETIITKTEPENIKALRFVEKLGFEKYSENRKSIKLKLKI